MAQNQHLVAQTTGTIGSTGTIHRGSDTDTGGATARGSGAPGTG
jgi:hypothetical protein